MAFGKSHFCVEISKFIRDSFFGAVPYYVSNKAGNILTSELVQNERTY